MQYVLLSFFLSRCFSWKATFIMQEGRQAGFLHNSVFTMAFLRLTFSSSSSLSSLVIQQHTTTIEHAFLLCLPCLLSILLASTESGLKEQKLHFHKLENIHQLVGNLAVEQKQPAIPQGTLHIWTIRGWRWYSDRVRRGLTDNQEPPHISIVPPRSDRFANVIAFARVIIQMERNVWKIKELSWPKKEVKTKSGSFLCCPFPTPSSVRIPNQAGKGSGWGKG